MHTRDRFFNSLSWHVGVLMLLDSESEVKFAVGRTQGTVEN